MPGLAVHLVWSSQLGAEVHHAQSATGLMNDPRVHHYWDGERAAGAAFQQYFPGLSEPAWDVWMLFAPGVVWEDGQPPKPSWWEHQLGVLGSTFPDRHLDAARFARKARELAGAATAASGG